MTTFYFALAALGAIIPYIFFSNFLLAEGANLTEFTRQLFANSPSSGFSADLLITSLAFWVWSFREATQQRMKNWWLYVVINLGIGLSCAFPLFLLFRQRRIENLATDNE